MDGFDVTTQRIGAAASGVEQVGTSLRREITHMEDLLADIGAGWRSTAAAPRFVAAMQGHLDQARQLAAALLSHAEGLSAVGRTFEATEAAIADATPAVVA